MGPRPAVEQTSGCRSRCCGAAPTAPDGRRDRCGPAVVRQLSAVRVVVHRDRRVRTAGLGTDPRVDDADRRARIWTSVRPRVLRCAAALDEQLRRRRPMAGAGGHGVGISRAVRRGGSAGAPTAGLADLGRGRVGRAGMGQIQCSVRRIPLGRSRVWPDRRPVAADRPNRRGAACVICGRAPGRQHGRPGERGHAP